MFKIKKGDTVEVIKGKDRGKRAKVLEVITSTGRALVEGINLAKKHRRKTQQDQQGGVVSIEVPINLSNLMLFCKNCNRRARSGFILLKDKTKSRICKRCKEVL